MRCVSCYRFRTLDGELNNLLLSLVRCSKSFFPYVPCFATGRYSIQARAVVQSQGIRAYTTAPEDGGCNAVLRACSRGG